MPSGGIQLKINMTEGAEWKSILRFTLPLMAANVLQQLYNIVDGIIVGNFVGQDALSAVGTCGPLTAFFIALAFGMSVGAGILISQYFGAQQHEALRETVSTTLLLMLGLGVAFTAIGIAVARPVLRSFLLVPDSFLDAAVSYFQIYCVGLLFSFAYNIVSFTLRSVGDSSSTLYFLLIAAVTNVGLDLLFVAVFRWGAAGAAWATNIAQALSAVVSLVYMQRRHALLRFRLRELRFHGDKARLCIRLGVPTTVQQIVVTCGTLAIQRVINSFGNDFIAGMTAANRAYAILTAPCGAFNNSTSTFAGQNLGAGKPERARRGAWESAGMCFALGLLLGIPAFLLAEPIVGLFGVGGEVCALGAPFIRVCGLALPVFGCYMAFSGTYRGAGDVLAATSITVFCLTLRTAATYFLAYRTDLGTLAVAYGLLFDWIPCTAIGTLRFLFGPWHEKALVRR